MVARKKTALKTFNVQLRHTRIEDICVTVEARDMDHASELALEMHEAGETADGDWDLSEDETEVTDIYPG